MVTDSATAKRYLCTNILKLKFALFFCGILMYCSGLSQDFPYVYVEYDSAWKYKNLTLIPIRFKDNGTGFTFAEFSNIISLEQALKTKKFTIREVQAKEGPDVNVVQLRNKTKQAVIIHSGELITGGKQDRVAAETIIIPPSKEDQFLNVFCAEKGRWDKKENKFTYEGSADATLRKVIDTKKLQHDVWKAIDEAYKQQNSVSETWPYKNIYRSYNRVADSGYYNFFNAKLAASDSAYAGFIAITGNSIIACDLYCNSTLTLQHFKSMLSGYVRVAAQHGSTPVLTEKEIAPFMRPILSDNKTRENFLENRGRIFRYGSKIVHIVAYGD